MEIKEDPTEEVKQEKIEEEIEIKSESKTKKEQTEEIKQKGKDGRVTKARARDQVQVAKFGYNPSS